MNKFAFIEKIAGHLVFFALFLIAWIFYQERATSFDSSFYAVNILVHENFYIAHNRGINFLWQWIPILAIKLGASLTSFLRIFSVAPILLMYGFYLFIRYALNNTRAATYLALSLVVLTRYKFYSSISEIYLSIGLVSLLVAWLSLKRDLFPKINEHRYFFGLIFFICFCYLGHPLIIYPILVVLISDLIVNNDWRNSRSWISIITAISLFAYRFLSMSSGSYEKKSMDTFSLDGFSELLIHPENFRSLHILKEYVFNQWALPLIFVILALWMLGKTKALLSVFLILASLFWALIVVVYCSYIFNDESFMIEGYFGFFALIWCLPILYLKLDQNGQQLILATSIVVLLTFGTHRIYSKRKFFVKRTESIRQSIAMNHEVENRNFVIEMEKRFYDKLWFFWSLPCESLLLSSLENKDNSSVLFISTSDRQTKEISSKKISYLPPFKDLREDIPEKYFSIDTLATVITNKIAW